MRLLTYNYFINKYIFNNQICKYNNYLPNKHKSFIFNTTDDVKNFIDYYHVKNHNFGDLSLSDEIIINDGTYNKTWLIAGFNTQLDTDVKNGTFGKHHLTLIPKDYLFTTIRLNDDFTNNKGFAGTEMFNKILPKINNNLFNILDNHLLSQKMMLSIDNKEKMKSFTAKSMLLNYNQVFGIDLPYQYYYKGNQKTSSEKYTNNDFDNGEDVFQIPLFKQDVKYKALDSLFWWLRNTYDYDYRYSSYYFAGVNSDGIAHYYYAIDNFNNIGIRPLICFG